MKEKKEREGWRLNKVAIIITVIWAVICLILMLIVYANDTENPQVSAVFFVLGAIPIVIVAVIESIRKKNFEEAERKKAAEIRKRYDAEQRAKAQDEYERELALERERESKALYKTTTKVVGVTFKNDVGIKRQDVLANMYETNTITLHKYLFKGKEPAVGVIDDASDEDFGNLSAELVADLAKRYPKAKWEAKIHSLDSFRPEDGKKEIHLCKIDLFIYKADDNSEIF